VDESSKAVKLGAWLLEFIHDIEAAWRRLLRIELGVGLGTVAGTVHRPRVFGGPPGLPGPKDHNFREMRRSGLLLGALSHLQHYS
jgi:hypothetical protein